MKIGYARAYNAQDLELQIQALKEAGCEEIYSESVSYKDNNRPELQEMLMILQEDDVVVIHKMDRIARSLKGLIEIIEVIQARQANLRSLDSRDFVDTTTPQGVLFFQIMGSIAQFERGMIAQRTRAGIDHALANGVKFGRVRGSKNPGIVSLGSIFPSL